MIRPAVVLVQKMCKTLPPKDPMDSAETESLEMSYAAALYQSGGQVDFRITAAMATLGIAIPRIIKYLDERDEKEKKSVKIPSQVNEAEAHLARLQAELRELEQKKATMKAEPVEVLKFEKGTVQ